MAQCIATGHPLGRNVDDRCPYEALWKGLCYFHSKVAEGLIVLESDQRKRQPVRRRHNELITLLKEWG